MIGYENILLATDFSDHSEAAGKRAVDLAQRFESKLTLFHVVEFYVPEIVPPRWMDAIQNEGLDVYLTREGQKSLEEFAVRINADTVKKEVVASTRNATHGIVNFAKQQKVNLIVLGSHGRHGIDLLLGSTANGVMHRAPCDVLAVRIDS